MNRLGHERLRPLAPYKQMYDNQPRTFSIPKSSNPQEWQAWRESFSDHLHERLGMLPQQRLPIPVTVAPPTTHDGYLCSYVEYESTIGVSVPAWLLVPAGHYGPAPAVIAVHGHGYGMDELIGINADGSERIQPEGYHQDFAIQLCRRGMVVLVPELRGFGRRREPRAQVSPTANSCRELAWWGIMLGKPLLGSRVWDVLRAVDVLKSLPEVDPQRVGIMGGSGGGAATLFAAALEPQLQAVVISNYFCTFKDSILGLEHCPCNYVPGLLQDAEIYDIAALIAPRPLLIEAGTEDPIFPLPGVLHAYEYLHEAYVAQGAVERLQKDVFVGGHQMSGAKAFDFLWQQLSDKR